MPLLRCLLLVLPCLVLGSAPTATASQGERRELTPQEEARLAGLRSRWSEKSASERELLRRRYEELRGMSPEDRRALTERARRWERYRQDLRTRVPLELTREIDELGPERSRERWRELVRSQGREMGRQRLERLPEHVRRRLERATPEERRRFLERTRADQDRHIRRALIHLGRRARLSRTEILGLLGLPLERRVEAVLELRGQLQEQGELRLPEAELHRRREPGAARPRRDTRTPDGERRPRR